jgi:hypothetical protein
MGGGKRRDKHGGGEICADIRGSVTNRGAVVVICSCGNRRTSALDLKDRHKGYH